MRTAERRGFHLWIVNLLTTSRLVAGLATVFAFQLDSAKPAIFLLFAYILTSDLLDGFLARRWGVTTIAGSIFDYAVDRFNGYLQVALLISTSVPVWVFLPFLLRDLLYIMIQAYAKLDRIVGTKALSFLGTAVTYGYVLWLAMRLPPSELINVALFACYVISAANLGWRIYRIRNVILARLDNEMRP